MTEETKDAPQVDVTEQQEAPSPAMPSVSSPAESSAQPSPDVSALVEAEVKKAISGLDDTLDNKVDARFKSGKDVRFSKVDEIYEWVEASGGNVAAIKQDMEIAKLREDLRTIQSGQQGDVSASPPLDSQWTVAQAQTDIILRNAGISPDDPEYNVMVSQYQGRITADAWPSVVETFAKGRRGGSAAAVVAETGVVAPGSEDIDSINERLIRATLTGAPAEDISALQEELKKVVPDKLP